MVVIDQIIRSKRKTLAIIVGPDGKITVRAPLRLSRARIQELVEAKSDWLRKHQEQVRQAQKSPAAPTYQPGEKFYYLGTAYPLEIVERAAPALALENGSFRLARPAQGRAAQVFEDWYRRAARQVIGERTQALARRFGYTYRSLRITSARTRWGSCGAKGTLNFTWRLVMAPEAAIDYVIVHELAHLEIRNHGRQFWERVATLCPDYARQRRWLRANAWLLK